MAKPFEVGTLSFARCQENMALSPQERVRLILAASDTYRPDLLVTAGYALHSRKRLDQLAFAIAAEPRRGIIITEVHHDGEEEQTLARQHAMYAVAGDGQVHRFGRQAFGTMRELKAPSKGAARFREDLPQRILPVGEHKVFALICGELNVLAGRDHPQFVDSTVEEPILSADIIVNPTHDRMSNAVWHAACRHYSSGHVSADIIVNPTHDRMSNAGTLHAKRRRLSQPHEDGRPRLYVSCSNWEACGLNGRRQSPSPTLHTVYLSGEPQGYQELADGAFGFVYRHWRVHL